MVKICFVYLGIIKKLKVMYSLNCDYFNEEFKSVSDLLDHIFQTGMDPNYEITKDGKSIGEKASDYITM